MVWRWSRVSTTPRKAALALCKPHTNNNGRLSLPFFYVSFLCLAFISSCQRIHHQHLAKSKLDKGKRIAIQMFGIGVALLTEQLSRYFCHLETTGDVDVIARQ